MQTMNDLERRKLIDSLRRNALNDSALLMDKDTSFVGTTDEDIEDETVINAVRSVPCHY